MVVCLYVYAYILDHLNYLGFIPRFRVAFSLDLPSLMDARSDGL